MGLQERSQEELKEVRKTISRFRSTVFQKWISSHRILDRFLLYNSEWLDKKLFVPVSLVPHTAKGRQEKTFSESSERSKRRKTEGLRKTTSTEELSFATAMSLRGSGNPSAARVSHEAVAMTPTRASKICQAWSEKKGGTAMWKYLEDEALCLLIDAQLSKRQYTTIQLQAKAKGADIYPAYNNVIALKKSVILIL